MRFYLLSDNVDTLVGMRLVGIEGVIIHKKEDLVAKLKEIIEDDTIAIVLMTTKVILLAPELISELKLRNQNPLFVEIPDRHGDTNMGESIDSYVSKAIGVKLIK
ncbi:V-type ATP synthase subunit F [Acholeplasma granularum]|uniref:V-type ATP synthase subunit F n=1 Tax=Acholeplasma granularum TaxID=264635 RepID=UPI000471E179|nr:V-type ATP synthase subunit F [Acholeplasma granularum]